MLAGAHVPMYKMRPKKGPLWLALLVVIVGTLLSANFYAKDAYVSENSRWVLTVAITCILTVFLIIAATSHFWFRHLWHHRPGYKRG